MGSCHLNHSVKDVLDKLSFQRNHLPEKLYDELYLFLQTESSQEIMNELFHLLKKYDLSTKAEQEQRNKRLSHLLSI